MSTAHLNDPGEVGGDQQPQAKTKKDWRKFRKYFLAAGLLLAALLAWWLFWPSKKNLDPAPVEATAPVIPDPAPVVTPAPTPVPASTPAPSPPPAIDPVATAPSPPPVVAGPVPVPAPLPSASTLVDEVAMPVTHEVIGGVKKRCVTTMLNGIEVQKDCFPVE